MCSGLPLAPPCAGGSIVVISLGTSSEPNNACVCPRLSNLRSHILDMCRSRWNRHLLYQAPAPIVAGVR